MASRSMSPEYLPVPYQSLEAGRAELAVDSLVVPLCPTSREMCSAGTPASNSSETKLCLSSLGVHWPGSSPADSTTLRKLRRMCEASAGGAQSPL
jgi:hypothetical protein